MLRPNGCGPNVHEDSLDLIGRPAFSGIEEGARSQEVHAAIDLCPMTIEPGSTCAL
jgi:hypothetical protein